MEKKSLLAKWSICAIEPLYSKSLATNMAEHIYKLCCEALPSEIDGELYQFIVILHVCIKLHVVPHRMHSWI